MGMFGWSYPPGAENDPMAPYNQDDEGDCEEGEDPSGTDHGELVRNIAELAQKCYEEDDPDRAARMVERGVYKYTECGCSFSEQGSHVLVSGYCEGSDGELPTYRLDYPFLVQTWWETLTQADVDGNEEWHRTHGCEKCWPDGYCGEWEELEFGNWPINPDCTECDGEGTIL